MRVHIDLDYSFRAKLRTHFSDSLCTRSSKKFFDADNHRGTVDLRVISAYNAAPPGRLAF